MRPYISRRGRWSDELIQTLPVYQNNTWKSVRVLDEASGQAYKIIASCTSERLGWGGLLRVGGSFGRTVGWLVACLMRFVIG